MNDEADEVIKILLHSLKSRYQNKCFQYSVTVALNYEEIKKDPQRITKTKPFINRNNWKGINFSSE